MKKIAVLCSLDTKGEEALFLKEDIERRGYKALVIDSGIRGIPLFEPDISREHVASRNGLSTDVLETLPRDEALERMTDCLQTLFRELYASGRISGAIAIGGATNMSMAAPALRALPIGVPKVVVSPVASGNTRSYVANSDMIMINSITDIMGVNSISRTIFRSAVSAIAGILDDDLPARQHGQKSVAITAFGVTTKAAMACKELLTIHGFDVLVFSASGSGGEAMEELISSGNIDGVIDLTITELVDEMIGGVLSAGPERLDAASKAGIPQLVVPGAIDMVNFGARNTIPAEFSNRQFYEHTPSVTLMRTTSEECRLLGRLVASKTANANVKILIPLGGVSELDKKSNVFYNPEAVKSFYEGLKEVLTDQDVIHVYDLHINDRAFAEAVVNSFLELAKF